MRDRQGKEKKIHHQKKMYTNRYFYSYTVSFKKMCSLTFYKDIDAEELEPQSFHDTCNDCTSVVDDFCYYRCELTSNPY